MPLAEFSTDYLTWSFRESPRGNAIRLYAATGSGLRTVAGMMPNMEGVDKDNYGNTSLS
jgi:hypothetical protein